MNVAFFGSNVDGVFFLGELLKSFSIKVVITNLTARDSWRSFLSRLLLRKRLTEDIARWKPGIALVDQCLLNKRRFSRLLQDHNIELGVVATFGKIIPQKVIDSIPLGIINLHASLLPKYRGADPIFWAIRNGEHEFGITVHFLNEHIDEGDIIVQRRIPIEPHHTIKECRKIAARKGVSLLKRVIQSFNEGGVGASPQKQEEATYFPPASEEYRTLKPSEQSYEEMRNIVRASMDKGGAFYWVGGEKVVVKSIGRGGRARGRVIRVSEGGKVYYFNL